MPSDKDSQEQVPASSWNYRVVEFSNEFGETFRAIHEVYYRHGVPNGYTEGPAVIMWDTSEGDDGALLMLQRMREALAKPVLTEKDFAKDSRDRESTASPREH